MTEQIDETLLSSKFARNDYCDKDTSQSTIKLRDGTSVSNFKLIRSSSTSHLYSAQLSSKKNVYVKQRTSSDDKKEADLKHLLELPEHPNITKLTKTNLRPNFDEDINESLKRTIERCWGSPEARPSAKEVHEFAVHSLESKNFKRNKQEQEEVKEAAVNVDDRLMTILAGNAGIHSVLAPSEYQRTFEDFRECCTTGGWGSFILRHHLRILFIICLVMVLWSVWTAFHPIGINRQEMWKNYRQELRILKKDYPGFTKADENTLLVVGEQWIVDAKTEPVVLTLGGPYSSSFAEKLMKILVKVSNGPTSRRAIDADGQIQRGQLHQMVKSELSQNYPPVAAVRSIDRLGWDAPLVLHAFSDSDSFPDVADPRNCEQNLTDQLTAKWIGSGGTQDNVPPIFSRILGYTICLSTPFPQQ